MILVNENHLNLFWEKKGLRKKKKQNEKMIVEHMKINILEKKQFEFARFTFILIPYWIVKIQ